MPARTVSFLVVAKLRDYCPNRRQGEARVPVGGVVAGPDFRLARTGAGLVQLTDINEFFQLSLNFYRGFCVE
jgi:hypothetical protein